MEKTNMLGLSTACVSASTAGILNESSFREEVVCDGLIAYAKGLYGWLVHVPSGIESEQIPEDLKRCMVYAEEQNCEWIMFDRDIEYDQKDGLPKFDW